MRLRIAAMLTAMSALATAGTAMATHVPQVDPATVPTGFLAVHNHVAEVPREPLRRIARAENGIDVFVQHVRLTAGADTGWHTHLGRAIVTVVGGALTTTTAAHGRPMGRYVRDSREPDSWTQASATSITRSPARREPSSMSPTYSHMAHRRM
jgi:quercetin dioxygenase-like cupin family protein